MLAGSHLQAPSYTRAHGGAKSLCRPPLRCTGQEKPELHDRTPVTFRLALTQVLGPLIFFVAFQIYRMIP